MKEQNMFKSTVPVKMRKSSEGRCDHFGNWYPTLKAMLEHYHVNKPTYDSRRRKGWTLEEALTGKRHKQKRSSKKQISGYDAFGRYFFSRAAMLDFYNIPFHVYEARRKQGWSLEEILRTPVKKKVYFDHLGNEYSTLTQMCHAYKISLQVYSHRKELGWDLEKSLTTPVRKVGKKKQKNGMCYDHLGNPFKSVNEMLSFYHIPRHIYDTRHTRGWNLEKILITPVRKYQKKVS